MLNENQEDLEILADRLLRNILNSSIFQTVANAEVIAASLASTIMSEGLQQFESLNNTVGNYGDNLVKSNLDDITQCFDKHIPEFCENMFNTVYSEAMDHCCHQYYFGKHFDVSLFH